MSLFRQYRTIQSLTVTFIIFGDNMELYSTQELKEMGIESFSGFYSTTIKTLDLVKKEVIALYNECNEEIKCCGFFSNTQGDVTFSVWKEDNNEYYAKASLKKTVAQGKGKVITEAIVNMFVDYYGYNFKGDFANLEKVKKSCEHLRLEHSEWCNERWD